MSIQGRSAASECVFASFLGPIYTYIYIYIYIWKTSRFLAAHLLLHVWYISMFTYSLHLLNSFDSVVCFCFLLGRTTAWLCPTLAVSAGRQNTGEHWISCFEDSWFWFRRWRAGSGTTAYDRAETEFFSISMSFPITISEVPTLRNSCAFRKSADWGTSIF